MGKKQKRKISKSRKTGMPPGSLVYIGNQTDKNAVIEVFNYNKDFCISKNVTTVQEAVSYLTKNSVTWINVNGLTQTEVIEELGKYAQLHSLFVEDILNTEHRPKLEVSDQNIFLIIKMLYFTDDEQLRIEHLAILLRENYVITFQEADGDVFGQLRKRLSQGEGTNIRQKSADYLVFGLLDAVIDHYYIISEKLSQQVENQEDNLVGNPSKELIPQIQELKREIIAIRRAIFPMREVINRLERISHPFLLPETKTYIADLGDHILQITETIDVYREIMWGLMDMYMSSMSHKMNIIMKTLTIISVIFIPLTFIVGVYGMNFDYMPELHHPWGYPIVWGIMVSIVLGMFWFFKKKKWW